DAADVLVHAALAGRVGRAHPVVGALVHHLLRVVGAGVAHEVPARIDEGVHRVGFALGGLAALRAAHAEEVQALLERVAAAIGHHIFGQHHGQVFFGHGHRAAAVAVDDGDGRAPVALARNAPVAQAPGGLLLAQALGDEQFGHLVDGVLV